MSTLVLKPYLYAIKNHILKKRYNIGNVTQGITVFILLSMLFVLIFYAGIFIVNKINEYSDITYLAPESIFSIVLFFLFFMCLFSALVLNVSILFFSNDHSLLKASPIYSYRLFFGKTTLAYLLSMWMPIFFITPLILSFLYGYQVSLFFYLPIIFIIAVLFLLANALAQIIALFFLQFRFLVNKITLSLLVIFSLVLLVYNLNALLESVAGKPSPLSAFAKIYKTLEFGRNYYLPSKWVSDIIGKIINSNNLYFGIEFYLLLLSTIFSTITAYFIWELSQNKLSYYGNFNKIKTNVYLKYLKVFGYNKKSSLCAKDLVLLTRDLSQIFQIFILLFIAIIYISHIELLSGLNFFPKEKLGFWRNILGLANVLIATFLITAISTRLIFPSVSLEGRAFWILKTAPMDIKEYLFSKLMVWYFPITIILSLFFGLGSYLLGYNFFAVSVYTLIAFFLAFSIVSLAIGIGAVYAKFNWEHSAEMAMSFGSFIFMLSAVSLTIFIQIPLVILIDLVVISGFALIPLILGLIMLLVLCYFLFVLGKDVIALGANKLEAKFS